MVARVEKDGTDPSEMLVVKHSTAEYALGALGGIVLAVWRTEISLKGVTHWGRLLSEMKSDNRLLGGLTFVEPDCQFPAPPAVTAASVELLSRHGTALRGFAMVCDRQGFAGAGVRSQVTAVVTESASGIPYTVKASLASAAGWLAERVGEMAAAQQAAMVAALEQLRRAPVGG